MFTEYSELCPRCREGEVIEVSDTSGVMELDEPMTITKVCNSHSPGFGVYLHPEESPTDDDTPPDEVVPVYDKRVDVSSEAVLLDAEWNGEFIQEWLNAAASESEEE